MPSIVSILFFVSCSTCTKDEDDDNVCIDEMQAKSELETIVYEIYIGYMSTSTSSRVLELNGG